MAAKKPMPKGFVPFKKGAKKGKAADAATGEKKLPPWLNKGKKK